MAMIRPQRKIRTAYQGFQVATWIFVLWVFLSLSGCAEVSRQVKSSLGLEPAQDLTAALTRAPAQWDDAMGQAAAVDPKVTEGQRLNNDPALNKRLQTMVDRLRAVSHAPQIPFRVKIIESKQVNAFNTGGELLYVYTGLIDYVKSDDELAGILAHEMAHGIGAHLQREQRSMFLPTIGAVLANVAFQNQTADQLIGLTNQALSSGYSRRHEREADILAVMYTYRAGYNPLGFEDFFARMSQQASQVKQEKEKELRGSYSSLQQSARELEQRKLAYDASYRQLQARPDSPDARRQLQQAEEQLKKSQNQHDRQSQQYHQVYKNYAQSITQLFPIFQSHPSDPERIEIVTNTLKYLKGEIPLSQTLPSVRYVIEAVEQAQQPAQK
ncbi:MAG: M48 family metallopeptidase [bacterium]